MMRLNGSRCYLCGPMDRVSDGGETWREEFTAFLKNLRIIPINPCKKPCLIAIEDKEHRQLRRQLLKEGEYDKVSEMMKEIRTIDLNLVDISDFMVVYWDTAGQMCGTMEEVFWGNRMKKPILIFCPQGKSSIQDWMFGVLPHHHMFSTWDGLKEYIKRVNDGREQNTYKRWKFLDFNEI